MPAVHFTVTWPDGSHSQGYSPSTVIRQHLRAGSHYPLDEFMQRLRIALNAASERVYQMKGFHCSAAMDSLAEFERLAARQPATTGTVWVRDMHPQS